MEKRQTLIICGQNLLSVFPSVPRPPYMKSVWSDTGVMVNMERAIGTEDWETSLGKQQEIVKI